MARFYLMLWEYMEIKPEHFHRYYNIGLSGE